MRVNEEKCTGCQQCIAFCPVEAIQLKTVNVGSKRKKGLIGKTSVRVWKLQVRQRLSVDALEETGCIGPSARAILNNPLVNSKKQG
jgi:Fe-S-cluster-containing hydrogenase component 2